MTIFIILYFLTHLSAYYGAKIVYKTVYRESLHRGYLFEEFIMLFFPVLGMGLALKDFADDVNNKTKQN